MEVSNTPIKVIRINNKIDFKDGNKSISIEPSKVSLEIDFELVYENKLIEIKNKFQIYEDELTDVFNSRTFVYSKILKNLERLV